MEKPKAEVTITVDPKTAAPLLNDNTEPNDPVTLVFNTSNWATPQTVTIKAFDDILPKGAETATIALSAASSDANCDQGTVQVSVNVFDNDSVWVIIEETDGATDVVEGGLTDSYIVVFDFSPNSDFTITVDDTGDPNQVTVDGGETTTLTFTPSNWDTPQTVTIEAINDDVPSADPRNTTLTHTVSQLGGDQAYDGFNVSSVSVTIGENDCGAGPFHEADFDENCVVNLLDFATLASAFLDCSNSICP